MGIEVVYEKGVFRPLGKVKLAEGVKGDIEIKENVVEKLFGVFKGKNLSVILEEVEDEWGIY